MSKQQVIVSTEIKQKLNEICENHQIRKVLLVCDTAFQYLIPREEYLSIDAPYVIFNEFTSNPLYEDVVKGVKVFRENDCDAILAIGEYREYLGAYCVPEYQEGEYEASNMYHPLLINPVKNSVSIHKSILITGSNASGKSTASKLLYCLLPAIA